MIFRFNKVVEVPTYTEMEYTQHLTSPEWSREETDHLMDLASRFGSLLQYLIHDHCIAGNGHWTYPGYPKVSIIFYFSRFDLRFIIMADRWDRETFSERSVEDLKER